MKSKHKPNRKKYQNQNQTEWTEVINWKMNLWLKCCFCCLKDARVHSFRIAIFIIRSSLSTKLLYAYGWHILTQIYKYPFCFEYHVSLLKTHISIIKKNFIYYIIKDSNLVLFTFGRIFHFLFSLFLYSNNGKHPNFSSSNVKAKVK